MSKARIRYSKAGRAKYISHLDLMATMQRAFLRAGVELKYSEGFNPHPYMSAALPLPVGYESLCEILDVGISNDALPNIETIKLPDGLNVHEAYKPVRKFSDIAWVEINVTLHYNKLTDDNLPEKLKTCFERDRIVILKRTKRGSKELDIAPFVKNVDFSNDEEIKMIAMVSAQNPTINLADLESIFDDELKPERLEMKRIDIYDSNMMKFM